MCTLCTCSVKNIFPEDFVASFQYTNVINLELICNAL